MQRYATKLGAIFYILWGLLHIVGAGAMLQTLGRDSGTALLAMLGSGVPANELPFATGSIVDAVLAYHSWNTFWVGIFVTLIGATLNWRNSTLGYWLNLAVVGAIDAGLLVTHLLPGIMNFSDGLPGLMLYALALTFSTIGLLTGHVTVEIG